MAILVTGGAGFIGSVTVAHLLSRGERIVVLDDLSRGHRQAIASKVIFYQGNAGDRNLLERITRDNEIESCIHFAALAYVGESMHKPREYFEKNLEQGIALFGSLLKAGVHRVVFSSSCATYGDPEQLPIVETARQWPINPYGWSKLLLERTLASYDAAYGLKFIALRYFNAAGATETLGEHHEPETHLIPNALKAASGERSKVAVFGDSYPTPDGTAIRDYIHVGDIADAHVRALNHLRRHNGSEFLNLASGRGYSVLEVIECVRQVTGRQINAHLQPPREGDPCRLVADSSKAQKVLSWQPRQSDLPTIVRTAWNWHLQHPKGYGPAS